MNDVNVYDTAPDGAKIYDERIGTADAEKRLKKLAPGAKLAAAVVREESVMRPGKHHYRLHTVAVDDKGAVVEYYRYQSDGRVVGLGCAHSESRFAVDASVEPTRERIATQFKNGGR